MDPKHLMACKLMRIDPMTGRKKKPEFTGFEKTRTIHDLKRKHFILIKDLELKDSDLIDMITRIRGGFSNADFYCKKYHPEKNWQQLSKVFYWIMRRLRDYK